MPIKELEEMKEILEGALEEAGGREDDKALQKELKEIKVTLIASLEDVLECKFSRD